MSKIEQLLKKHCPDGVEYKPLGEVAKICRGVRVVKKELSSTGAYEVFQNSLKPLGLYGEANVKGGTAFVIGAGAAGEVGYSVNDFWAADDCYYIDGGEWLIGRYVYYCLTSRQAWLSSKVRKASIPRLSRDLVSALEVPLPPIEIQREVVEVLDKFALLEAELEAELAKRKKQYEHYRRALLCRRGVPAASEKDGSSSIRRGEDAASTSDWPRVKLGEVCEFMTGFAFKASMFHETGEPICKTTNIQDGEIRFDGMDCFNPADYKEDLDRYIIRQNDIVIGMSGTIKVGINKTSKRCYLNQRVGKFSPRADLILNGYLYFQLLNSVDVLCDNLTGGSVKNLSNSDVRDLTIPLPPLAEQERIVAILDRFDALCNSLSEGLPAEIERRKKQYAYYRDKLLDFKRKGAA